MVQLYSVSKQYFSSQQMQLVVDQLYIIHPSIFFTHVYPLESTSKSSLQLLHFQTSSSKLRHFQVCISHFKLGSIKGYQQKRHQFVMLSQVQQYGISRGQHSLSALKQKLSRHYSHSILLDDTNFKHPLLYIQFPSEFKRKFGWHQMHVSETIVMHYLSVWQVWRLLDILQMMNYPGEHYVQPTTVLFLRHEGETWFKSAVKMMERQKIARVMFGVQLNSNLDQQVIALYLGTMWDNSNFDLFNTDEIVSKFQILLYLPNISMVPINTKLHLKAAIINTLVFVVTAQKLLMIQSVFRHGARYPIFPNSIDNSSVAQQWQSVGQLTTQGKNMHHILGEILYEKYWKQLFGGTPYENQYNQSQFYIQSTNVNRTIESVQSQLYGWLENLPVLTLQQENFNYSLPAWLPDSGLKKNTMGKSWSIFNSQYHPTPIHLDGEESGNFLRKYDVMSCPNQQYWQSQNKAHQSNEIVLEDQRVKDALSELSKAINETVDMWDVYKWTDNQVCMKYLGLSYFPIFDSQNYGPTLQFIDTYTTYKRRFSSKPQIRAISTPFLEKLLNNIEAKIQNDYSPKVVLYSAHDTTIGMVLSMLQMATADCIANRFINNVTNDEDCIWKYPQFASNIIFELWANQQNNTKYYIKILYEGVERKIPICGNETQCQITKFQKWAHEFMVDDVENACGYNQEDRDIIAIVFIFGSLLLIVLLYLLYQKYRNKIQVKNYEQYTEERGEKDQKQLHQ